MALLRVSLTPGLNRLGHTSEQRRRALSRPHLGSYQGGRVFAMVAAFTIHGASRQKFPGGSFWPFILAHCEVAEPSICINTRQYLHATSYESDGLNVPS